MVVERSASWNCERNMIRVLKWYFYCSISFIIDGSEIETVCSFDEWTRNWFQTSFRFLISVQTTKKTYLANHHFWLTWNYWFCFSLSIATHSVFRFHTVWCSFRFYWCNSIQYRTHCKFWPMVWWAVGVIRPSFIVSASEYSLVRAQTIERAILELNIIGGIFRNVSKTEH